MTREEMVALVVPIINTAREQSFRLGEGRVEGGALWSHQEAARYILDALGIGEPVAWRYELARRLDIRGKYCDWHTTITEHRPNVPPKSMRNLVPLYALTDTGSDE